MLLYTLINTFISRCFQLKTKENKHTQTEPCLAKRTKRRGTQTVEEPFLQTTFEQSTEQATAPEDIYVSTDLLPIRIEKRKNNETVQKFFYRIWQKHGVHMRTPRREFDGHGHMFYCFSCRLPYKDHRSFDSKEALESHCEAKHQLKITI